MLQGKHTRNLVQTVLMVIGIFYPVTNEDKKFLEE